jgi:hypothetical protein
LFEISYSASGPLVGTGSEPLAAPRRARCS